MATSISATLPPIAYVPAAAGAQATLLYHEGVTPSEIGSILGLSASTVDSYLGIASNSATSAASVPQATESSLVNQALPKISVFA
jgi:DNA-directed RNA polymerase specialized sigma24 family protein